MRLILLFGFWCFNVALLSQDERKQFLYLENTQNQKVKKINLLRYAYFCISVDSTSDYFERDQTYYSANPSSCIFGKDRVLFSFNDYSEYSYYDDGILRYDSSKDISLPDDSIVGIPYTNQQASTNIYLSYQTPFRLFMHSTGMFLAGVSFFNAVIVAPLIGMNNGSFKDYNWQRFWRYELYSAIGLGLSIPLGICFEERRFYFQSRYEGIPIWRVKGN